MNHFTCLLGLPGAGKSSQSALLSEAGLGTVHSAGDWLRARANRGNRQAGDLIRNGLPMPLALFEEWLDVMASSREVGDLILDGSPRTPEQALYITTQLPQGSFKVTGVVLELSLTQARTRLLARASGNRVRDDDAPVLLDRRLEVQSTLLTATASCMAKRVPVIMIDASRDATLTAASILQALPA